MPAFPAIPMWTDAYLADCSHLSDAEHGRYHLLLYAMWRAPNQRLPNDDEWLARKFTRSVEAVQREIRPLIAEFCKCDGNWITQSKLTDEWNYLKQRSKQQSVRAKSRWDNDKKNAGAYAASGNAPTPTPIKKVREENTKNGGGSVNSAESRSTPRHGATGNGHTFIHTGTEEWEAYSRDFQEVRGFSPEPERRRPGRWFKTVGER